ncbi:MAG TPA: hypothetical protein VK100_10095 [Pseudogracilibacillus sp.]|nr:hypothetical protein [Pseudogracilibacillus sp.]
MLTEKDYGVISQEVYGVDSNATDYDPNLKEKATREIEGEKYKVLKTEDNTSNDMQAMAVAPIKNGTADTSEVVIAYAGTNFDDEVDIHTDLQTVIGRGKDYLFKPNGYFPLFSSIEDSQIATAEKFADDIKTDYPEAEVTTTGHSLGEYIALYVAAENQWGNVGFNGPDPYDILSPEAKEWVENNSDMLFNYRNTADPLGNYGGNGTGAGIPIDMDMGINIGENHGLDSWEFDEEGNLEIDSSYDNKDAFQTQGEKLLYGNLVELSLLANKLQANGGGLSSNEVVFLNNAQALLTVEYITESTNAAIESIVNTYKDAIDQLEEAWEKGIELAKLIGTELSYGEILEALEAGGVTKYDIVFEPMAYYREKITEVVKIGEDFESLASDIKENIEKLVETDEDLADQIKQGV